MDRPLLRPRGVCGGLCVHRNNRFVAVPSELAANLTRWRGSAPRAAERYRRLGPCGESAAVCVGVSTPGKPAAMFLCQAVGAATCQDSGAGGCPLRLGPGFFDEATVPFFAIRLSGVASKASARKRRRPWLWMSVPWEAHKGSRGVQAAAETFFLLRLQRSTFGLRSGRLPLKNLSSHDVAQPHDLRAPSRCRRRTHRPPAGQLLSVSHRWTSTLDSRMKWLSHPTSFAWHRRWSSHTDWGKDACAPCDEYAPTGS